MKKIAILICLLSFISLSGMSQDQNTEESKIWYLWIDTTTDIDGKSTRIVSKEPFEISCCLKSPKYRKLAKKAEKWIKKNVAKDYEGSPFNKIQDKNLAKTMIEKAATNAGEANAITLVDYLDQCNE